MSSFDPHYIFFAAFGAFIAYFVYQVSTKGIKGAMFGGKIDKTYGELSLEKRSIVGKKLRLYRVKSPQGTKIGLEIVQTSILSYQMTPVTLSKDEAIRLIQLLTAATSDG